MFIETGFLRITAHHATMHVICGALPPPFYPDRVRNGCMSMKTRILASTKKASKQYSSPELNDVSRLKTTLNHPEIDVSMLQMV
ncbi:hypothetical protein MPTK1_6g12620 [Marchantia polymorpha subsp. ruderalis]|uniref:Uncharacterized protein n=2 Tax=Marchantia polymorpha TaxID=3197 RepID=A0AAF6BRC7_MARPO|nr:hypothetical protein MARPO_0059s0085 [Marchantia polymorpha]BBN14561.1 hypothetical protein Mp_6g12620 [Marchantia polymorpha subsp. ruderalis]|eukprot:PTQ37159.1 hypothetical protein MARPO_0059s0085 [Marchantia polymorpha]